MKRNRWANRRRYIGKWKPRNRMDKKRMKRSVFFMLGGSYITVYSLFTRSMCYRKEYDDLPF